MADLPTQADIRAVAKDVLQQMLRGQAHGGADASVPAPRQTRELVNEADVIAARDKGGVLVVAPGSLVTPLARDAAERFQVEIRFGNAPGGKAAVAAAETAEGAEPAPRAQGGAVAVGSDHGGFKLKEAVKSYLEAQGVRVLDQGTTSESACDYPDLAARVARAVSLGEASWGVFVDGAGIGGAMVLNKVPGVFAATCHDAKAATNAREHNRANVLCLGSGWVDAEKMKPVVDAFLGTGFGGGRHLKRVQKIVAIEKSFTGRTS